MTRTIQRTYKFSQEDVRNALCEFLRKRDIQSPQYIGNTPCTKWSINSDGSQTVEWTVEDDPTF
jgi:hypothetical protein